MRPDPDAPDAQQALAARIRDPVGALPPAGVDPRRLEIYGRLFFNNVSGLLAGTFPVVRAVLGEDGWDALVRDFLREHGARTPVFSELAAELLHYLDARIASARDDAPWLRELAHYEWVELALQLSEDRPDDVPHDPTGALDSGVPVLSPLAWPLAYDWPVHRIAPDHLPASLSPTWLLVHREPNGDVRFHELSALTFHLLHRIAEASGASGRGLLLALASEVGATDAETFARDGLALLEDYRRQGIILGTHRAA